MKTTKEITKDIGEFILEEIKKWEKMKNKTIEDKERKLDKSFEIKGMFEILEILKKEIEK